MYMCVCVCVCVCKCAQSCMTLCNPMDYSPPGSSVHGILQARLLKHVAIPYSGDPHDPWIETVSLASKEHEHRINTVTEYNLEDIIGDIWIHKVEWAFRIYKKSKSQIKPDFTYMMKRYCYHTREESSGTGIDCVLC